MNTSIINVQVDSYDKKLAEKILDNLGLDIETYINMTIKRLIYKNGLPFDVKLSDTLINALKEADEIEENIKEGNIKGYNNVDEMMKAILND